MIILLTEYINILILLIITESFWKWMVAKKLSCANSQCKQKHIVAGCNYPNKS